MADASHLTRVVKDHDGQKLGLEELWDVDDDGDEDSWENEGVEVDPGGAVEVPGAEVDGPPDGHEALRGDAHDDVRLAAEQDVLQGVQEVGEQDDVGLVLDVHVQLETVKDEEADEEQVDDGEGEDALVEVRPPLEAEDYDDGAKVAENSEETDGGDPDLGHKKVEY
jgi:hypothetical protein